ncbi:uncharacterized protein N7484_000212 [Penicillium longicatenatum]|uniref:uncharacterized protein n=1 Tax=Penicillium longicatenatum TaxID=1561947 RepID=UPI00254990C9|nr:uncharacterized protein N7484_000212 [Penicillium longicatenatum]KAJ5660840.1 hypothetical protein N7484_000212 [Penicillium longicatenatum]
MSIPFQRAMPLGSISIGRSTGNSIHPVSHMAPSTQNSQWQFLPGIYTPRQFIAQLAVIPESILVQLGPDDASSKQTSRDILMDGLRSSLSQEGRESTLPLPDWKSATPSEMTQQAKNIGDTLLQYALEDNYSVAGIADLKVFSPCEGHKWVPPAGQLLRSSRGSPILMMLYNEWLHQITCLRDSLLSFENFKEVQLDLSDPSHRGTRRMESFRDSYLFSIRAQTHTDADILEAAKVLTAPTLPQGGYGFQYSRGTVLPAALFTQSETRLLRYFPVHVHETDGEEECVLFDFPNFNLDNGFLKEPECIALDTKSEQVTSHASTGTLHSGLRHNIQLTGKKNNGETVSFDLDTALLGL